MKKTVMQKWVSALLSGKYKQGDGFLKKGGKYCCLGVLCDISKKGTFLKSHYQCKDTADDGSLPMEVMTWAGMSSSTGELAGLGSLADLNDNAELSFEAIAAIIEDKYKEL